jgi:hypothetical protein
MEIDDSPKIYSVNDNCFIKYGFVNELAFGDDENNNETLYIYLFKCVYQPIRYNGRRMLLSFLQMIKSAYPNIKYIELMASSSEGIWTDKPLSSDLEKNQMKLNEYYIKLGFILVDPDFNVFRNDINTIIETISRLDGGKRIKYQKIKSRKIRKKSRRRIKKRSQISRRK